MKDVAMFLCDRSGVMAQPWADAGFECYCVDIQHSIRRPRREGNITYQWGDVRTWCPPEDIRNRIAFVAAFPPCTHTAVSGARDFRTKGTGLLRDSLEIFAACEHAAKWCGAPYMIENPVGVFSSHMGQPDHTFQPWQYGDPWTKNTCLWTGNGFVMPSPSVLAKPAETEVDRILAFSPGADRQNLRAETPPGFARAVFEANAATVAVRESPKAVQHSGSREVNHLSA